MDTLRACVEATRLRIPIAHIHGGEETEGSFDNAIRHAITKLSHLHFVAHDEYAKRVIQMGENPANVYVVGAPGLDNLVDLPPRNPTKTFILTYHPCTATDEDATDAIIEGLSRFPDYRVIWTGVNNDPGYEKIAAKFEKAYGLTHYSPRHYLLACRQAACVIGNSSSGIIEMPSLGVPTVDIGSRQYGRLSGTSVFWAAATANDIAWTIEEALGYGGSYSNHYGGPGASKKIAEIIANVNLDGILVKRWH